MKLMKTTIIVLFILLTTGCNGKYGGMSDTELTDKKRHCDSVPKKSAVFANGCEKVDKEIKRRKAQKK